MNKEERVSPYVLPGLILSRRTIDETVHLLLQEMEIDNVETLRANTRLREVVRKRQVVMHLLKWYGFTTLAIGEYFRKDHATVIHSAKTVENDMLTDRDLRQFVLMVKKNQEIFTKNIRLESNNTLNHEIYHQSRQALCG